MGISASVATWFLPLALPICLYVCYTDLSTMRIRNHAVIALFAVFALLGPFVIPLDVYAWRYVHLAVVLIAGIALNAGGALGAGDAKFAAAAAPFVHIADLRFLLALFAATLLTGFAVHRAVKHTALHRMAPDWESWRSGSRFPMGLALGGTLILYLVMGALYGR
ncbi:prepilin peptidase [Citreimonas salinaria]|uniref:Prepilin peptidase CpaA n=1 Tax=Citreimonas salinaria TaxID=321339 RepID=A0A1H3MHQ7_9RHOB|nr:prepilin peptidase [Citreimonas salinaria]SDY76212.1 prepilin peptidase CpaA [Citreimonas salinaria]